MDSFPPGDKPKGLKVYPTFWVILGVVLFFFLQAVTQDWSPQNESRPISDQIKTQLTNEKPVEATPEELADQALQIYADKDYDAAEQLAKKASHLEQSSTRRASILALTDYILGLCEAHKGNIPSAISRLENSCRLEPKDKDYRKMLSSLRAYHSKQQRIIAERTLHRLSSLLAKERNLGPREIQTVISETVAVMAILRQHGGNNEQMSRTLIIKSWALATNGRTHEALKILHKARRLNDNPGAREIEAVLVANIKAAETRPYYSPAVTEYETPTSPYDEQGSDVFQSDEAQDSPDEDYSASADSVDSSESSADAYQPGVAENGDIQGIDNDGDGRVEPVFVRGYTRRDGTRVRSHYRARPR